MRTPKSTSTWRGTTSFVGMKPLSERDENTSFPEHSITTKTLVGMKPLSERDENTLSI